MPTTSVAAVPPHRTRPGRVLRLPGVYRPQADTWLLADALASAELPPGARVLDYCTGSGAVALAAARCGASDVVAVDISGRAAVTAWLNTRVRRLPVSVRRGGLEVARRHGPFDVVLANPPYVPAAGDGTRRGDRCWDGGPAGRTVVAPLCGQILELLRPGGTVLLVHSAVADPQRTISELRTRGLAAETVARARLPFGPVMRRQAPYLAARGLIRPGQCWEDVVVIRGDRPPACGPGSPDCTGPNGGRVETGVRVPPPGQAARSDAG